MCRNETQEKQYDSCYSSCEKQDAINNPEIGFMSPFNECDSQHNQEKAQQQTSGVKKPVSGFTSSVSPFINVLVELTNSFREPSAPVMVAVPNASFR